MTIRSIHAISAGFAILLLGFVQSVQADDYPHLLFGNPSQATEDHASKDNFLMKKKFYALSYNNSLGTPNWVSWRVTKEDITGDAQRKRIFDPDQSLPKHFKHINTKDYAGSGFDRGHMCPHSDRLASQEMSYSTFVMTNIIPQAPNVNQKAWNQLEIYTRNLIKHKLGRRLYIVTGPAGTGGTGKEGFKKEIGKVHKVNVPAFCWKIILVVDGDNDDASKDLRKVDKETRVIAVVMPNDNNKVEFKWAGYRTSVAEIEKLTGFKFFTALPEDIRNALREKVDDVRINNPAPPRRNNKRDQRDR